MNFTFTTDWRKSDRLLSCTPTPGRRLGRRPSATIISTRALTLFCWPMLKVSASNFGPKYLKKRTNQTPIKDTRKQLFKLQSWKALFFSSLILNQNHKEYYYKSLAIFLLITCWFDGLFFSDNVQQLQL